MPSGEELCFPGKAKKQLVIQAARGLFIKQTLGCLLLICFNIEAHLLLLGWRGRREDRGDTLPRSQHGWGKAWPHCWVSQCVEWGQVMGGFEEMLALSCRQSWRRWRRQLVGRRELLVPGAGAERDCRALPKIHSVGSARSPGGGSIPPGYPRSPPSVSPRSPTRGSGMQDWYVPTSIPLEPDPSWSAPVLLP